MPLLPATNLPFSYLAPPPIIPATPPPRLSSCPLLTASDTFNPLATLVIVVPPLVTTVLPLLPVPVETEVPAKVILPLLILPSFLSY